MPISSLTQRYINEIMKGYLSKQLISMCLALVKAIRFWRIIKGVFCSAWGQHLLCLLPMAFSPIVLLVNPAQFSPSTTIPSLPSPSSPTTPWASTSTTRTASAKSTSTPTPRTGGPPCAATCTATAASSCSTSRAANWPPSWIRPTARTYPKSTSRPIPPARTS